MAGKKNKGLTEKNRGTPFAHSGKPVIFQTKAGGIELRGDLRQETIWASQAQVAAIFGVERSVVTKHINNILKDKELDKQSVCAFFAHTAEEVKTTACRGRK